MPSAVAARRNRHVGLQDFDQGFGRSNFVMSSRDPGHWIHNARCDSIVNPNGWVSHMVDIQSYLRLSRVMPAACI